MCFLAYDHNGEIERGSREMAKSKVAKKRKVGKKGQAVITKKGKIPKLPKSATRLNKVQGKESKIRADISGKVLLDVVISDPDLSPQALVEFLNSKEGMYDPGTGNVMIAGKTIAVVQGQFKALTMSFSSFELGE
jgi:hypothetical protein